MNIRSICYWLRHYCFFRRNNIHVSHAAIVYNTSFENNIGIWGGGQFKYSIIGRFTYVGEGCSLNNCKIGRYCSIGRDVRVVERTHPSKVFVSTSPVFFSTQKPCGVSFVDHEKFDTHKTIDGFNVIIGNDVWIGDGVLILGGVRIHDGAIIGMGAVVTKDVPAYSVVVGVPARVMRYRFTEEQISSLLEIRWWDRDQEWIQAHVNTFDDIEMFLHEVSMTI